MTDTRIGLAGDWHGSFQWTRHALHTFGQTGIKNVFHVGDFSLGWPGLWPDLINICESICRHYDMELWVTPGNHENWEWINTREFQDGVYHMTSRTHLLQRNHVMMLPYPGENGKDKMRKVLSLGGAPSIDFNMRFKGQNWWPEEMILLEEAEFAAQVEDVDIMLCHDAPDGGTPAVQKIIDMPWNQSIFSREGLMYAKEGRFMMNLAVWGQYPPFTSEKSLPGARPKVFAHGHFHAADVSDDDTTLWISLGCNNQANNLGVLDLEHLSFEWLDIITDSSVIRQLEKVKNR